MAAVQGADSSEVKRLNCYSFWIKPFGQEDFSKMSRLGAAVPDCLFRRLDRWTEAIGPVLNPVWVRLEGIPLHAWHERVFARIGECLGVVMEVDEEAKNKNRINQSSYT